MLFSSAMENKDVLKTYATTGSIATPHYREVFKFENFKVVEDFTVEIFTPVVPIYDYETLVEVFKENYLITIEYDIEPKYECIRFDSLSNECLNKNVTKYEGTFHEFDGKRIIFTRDFFNYDEILKWKKKRSTGFIVHWNCTNCQNIKIGNSFSWKKNNKIFVKIANVLHMGTYPAVVWKAFKQAKISKFQSGNSKYQDGSLEEAIRILNLNRTVPSLAFENISDKNLEVAAAIFAYYLAPTQTYWTYVFDLYMEWLSEHLSVKRMLGKYLFTKATLQSLMSICKSVILSVSHQNPPAFQN